MRHPVATIFLYIFVIYPLLLFVIAGFVVKATILKPEFVHSQIKQTGGYEKLAEQLPHLMATEPTALEGVTIDPAYVETTSQQLIFNITNYLNGKTPTLKAKVDLMPIYNALAQAESQKQGSQFSSAELQKMMQEQGIKDTEVDLFPPGPSGAPNQTMQTLNQIRSGLKIFKILLWVALVLLVGLLFSVAYWCRGRIKSMFNWLAVPLFIYGVIWIILILISKMLTRASSSNIPAAAGGQIDFTSALLPAMTGIASHVQNIYLAVFVAISAVCLILIIVAAFLPKPPVAAKTAPIPSPQK